MLTQSITPIRLLRDSLISVIPIYTSLLVFIIPGFIFSLLQFVIPKIWFTVLANLYFLSIGTIFNVALIFFAYKKLNQEEVTIYQALQKATEKFSEILIFEIFQVLLLLFFFPRLYFGDYLIIIKNYPAPDAVQRCWLLTKGYGWRIFGNLLIINIIQQILNFIGSLITASIFGVSVWEVNSDALSATNAAFIVNNFFQIPIYYFIYRPLSKVFVTLMFVRLLARDKRKLGSSVM
ncbi:MULTISPECIES: hypothetical protein [unclassified Nostoc]|uniref:hypothetical protein n=1 Tax=unclassified Nostoc TaxID=2593658 RepID=UPI00262FD0A5|nr:hypothetical protein [Nostoc sp. S13]MDF5736073.1 hypothetical protein [Nostoc sp. S13]